MNFLVRLRNSISNFEFYKNIQNETVGKAFLYLTKITIIFGIISLINPVLGFDRGVDLAQDYFQENIPDFVFEDGELKVKSDQPFVWEDKESDIIVAMDTSGQVGPEILDEYSEGFYITKNYAIFKRNGIEKREFDFSQLKEVKFNKDDVSEWIPYAKWANGFIVIFGLIWFMIGKLWSTLLLALFGLLLCAGKNRFSDLYKISIYVLTLSIIIKTAKVLFTVEIPWFGLIYYGIAAFYMWKAVGVIKDKALTE